MLELFFDFGILHSFQPFGLMPHLMIATNLVKVQIPIVLFVQHLQVFLNRFIEHLEKLLPKYFGAIGALFGNCIVAEFLVK